MVSIVFHLPFKRNSVHFLNGLEQIRIQNIFSKSSVESFDICVLCRLTRLDVSNVYFLSFTEVHKGLGDKLRPIVCSNDSWLTTLLNQSLQGIYKPFCRNGEISFIDQCFSIVIIDHVQIQPGKPTQNSLIERFNGSYRKEVLNTHLFFELDQVRDQTQKWLYEYNNIRPHKSLGYKSPIGFVKERRKARFPSMVIDKHLMENTIFKTASH